MAKTAQVFAESGNIYESYNMSGGRAGDTGGNSHWPYCHLLNPSLRS
jgi:hypothetical protein